MCVEREPRGPAAFHEEMAKCVMCTITFDTFANNYCNIAIDTSEKRLND